MLKFKTGDNVKVILGKDKGREGKIEKIFSKKSLALVAGVNLFKKHIKGAQGRKGGVYEIERPIAFSKIALICPKCKKVTKVKFKGIEKEKKRLCGKCGRQVDEL